MISAQCSKSGALCHLPCCLQRTRQIPRPSGSSDLTIPSNFRLLIAQQIDLAHVGDGLSPIDVDDPEQKHDRRQQRKAGAGAGRGSFPPPRRRGMSQRSSPAAPRAEIRDAGARRESIATPAASRGLAGGRGTREVSNPSSPRSVVTPVRWVVRTTAPEIRVMVAFCKPHGHRGHAATSRAGFAVMNRGVEPQRQRDEAQKQRLDRQRQDVFGCRSALAGPMMISRRHIAQTGTSPGGAEDNDPVAAPSAADCPRRHVPVILETNSPQKAYSTTLV